MTKVGGVEVSNGPIQTVAGNSSVTTTNAVNGTVPRSRPSDLGSELVQLDASQLHDNEENTSSLQEELGSANKEELTSVVKKKKVETPSNELSLEAELSAAFASSQDEPVHDLSLDEEIIASSTPKSESGKQFPPFTEESEVKEDDADDTEQKENNADKDKSTDALLDEPVEDKLQEASASLQKSNAESEPQEIREAAGTTIILEDESVAESPVPDIVATSLIKAESETPPDFMTSTPKKPDADKSENIAESSQYQSLSDNSTQYVTALSSQHSTSTDADDSAEFSFLGEKKFAALLQTVPSYEGDDSEVMSSFGSTSLDKSTDEMVSGKLGNITPTPVSVTQDADQKLLTDQNDSTTTIQANESQLQESPLMPMDDKKEESKEG